MIAWLVAASIGVLVGLGEPPAGSVGLVRDGAMQGWMRDGGGRVGWEVDGDVVRVVPGSGSIRTEREFGDAFIHVEFRLPRVAEQVTGQARSNSGVYVQKRYEVQILDSYGGEPEANTCGAIYGQRAADVNASLPAGEWQRFDIDFTAARFDEAGNKTANARMTVRHNGVLIHDDVEVTGKTGAGQAEGPSDGPLLLQDHGNPVEFRNVWVVPTDTWVDVFDGDSIEGWVKRGGAAEYWVEDGAIVGETRPNTDNTFLCTARDYDDFLLSLEFKVDDGLNSGVQIRSLSTPEYQNGRVHGYQVEIDPSERAWTAGIYDEARGGWLNDLKDNQAAREAFRHGEWNHILVQATSDRIRTWLNGVPAADLTDDTTPRGFIGLQVHGVGDRADPLRVRWRKLKIRELSD
jgi:hypothetical protein